MYTDVFVRNNIVFCLFFVFEKTDFFSPGSKGRPDPKDFFKDSRIWKFNLHMGKFPAHPHMREKKIGISGQSSVDKYPPFPERTKKVSSSETRNFPHLTEEKKGALSREEIYFSLARGEKRGEIKRGIFFVLF